jgi:predicted transcriptional regulator
MYDNDTKEKLEYCARYNMRMAFMMYEHAARAHCVEWEQQRNDNGDDFAREAERLFKIAATK